MRRPCPRAWRPGSKLRVHCVNRLGCFDTRRTSVLLSNGICALGPRARADSIVGLKRWSASASAAFRMRRPPFMIASVLGMKSVPISSGLRSG